MKQTANTSQANKQPEPFNADLCMLVLGSTRSVDEKQLHPIVLK